MADVYAQLPERKPPQREMSSSLSSTWIRAVALRIDAPTQSQSSCGMSAAAESRRSFRRNGKSIYPWSAPTLFVANMGPKHRSQWVPPDRTWRMVCDFRVHGTLWF